MGNNKDFIVKNGIRPSSYHESLITRDQGYGDGYSIQNLTFTHQRSFDFHTNTGATISDARAFAIKPDGTKGYVLDQFTAKIHAFDFPAGKEYDVSSLTANTYSTSSTGSFATNTSLANDFVFSPDGTKVFILDDGDNGVQEYILGSPWDVTTLTFESEKVGLAEAAPRGLTFSEDGYWFYIVGTGGRVYSYLMSTPWDISTKSGSAFDQDFVLSSSIIPGTPQDISFNKYGTKMWILNYGTGAGIYQYSLSTPWQVSSASYDNIMYDTYSLDLQDLVGSVNGVTLYSMSFVDDPILGEGAHLYLFANGTPRSVYQFSTVSIKETLNTSGSVLEILPGPSTNSVNVGGATTFSLPYTVPKYTYTINITNNGISDWTITSGQDRSGSISGNDIAIDMHVGDTLSFQNYAIGHPLAIKTKPSTGDSNKVLPPLVQGYPTQSADGVTPAQITFTPTEAGTYYYQCQAHLNMHGIINVTAPRTGESEDITVLLHGNKGSFNLDSVELNSNGRAASEFKSLVSSDANTGILSGRSALDITMSYNGRYAYVLAYDSTGSEAIYQYELSTPYDITTAEIAGYHNGSELQLPVSNASTVAIAINNDGTIFYSLSSGTASQRLYQYKLTTPYDITTITDDVPSLSIGTNFINSLGFHITGDGKYLFFTDYNDDKLARYTLGDEFDISQATYDTAQEVQLAGLPNVSEPRGISLSPDGLNLFICDADRRIHHFDLAVPFEIDTISANVLTTITVDLILEETLNLDLARPGHYIYTTSGSSRRIRQISLGSYPYDTITYPDNVQWPDGTVPPIPDDGSTDVIIFNTVDGGATYQAAIAIEGAK